MRRLAWLATGAAAAAIAILVTWWTIYEISTRMLGGQPDAERLQRLELGYQRQLLVERLRRSGMPPSDAADPAVSRETRGGP